MREQDAKRLAHRIANGHAYAKHAREFGTISLDEFERLIYTTIVEASDVLTLPRGRMAYWSDAEQLLVLHDPSHYDAGTAFRPEDRKDYFLRLAEIDER